MSMSERIEARLTAQFSPLRLEVIDESHHHHGHAGGREGGETHFRVRIATRDLDGLSRVAQHRAVMNALEAELKERVHALNIEILPTG